MCTCDGISGLKLCVLYTTHATMNDMDYEMEWNIIDKEQ